MRRERLLLLYLIMFLDGFLLIIIGPLLDPLMRSFHLRKFTAGLFSSGFFLGILLGMLLAGALARGRAPRRVLLCAMGLSTFGILGFVQLRPWLPAMILFDLAGFANGFLFAYLTALAAELAAPGELPRAMNHLYSAFGLGMMLGPFLAQGILSHGGGWRPAFTLVGLAMGGLWLWTALSRTFVEIHGETRDGASGGGLRILHGFRHSHAGAGLAFLAIALLLYVGAESGVNVWMSKYLLDVFHFRAAGYILTLFWVVMILGRLAVGQLAHRFPVGRMLWFLALLGSAGVLAAAGAGSAGASIAAFLVVGLGFSGIYPLLMALGGQLPGERGMNVSFLTAAGEMGAVLLTPVVGLVAEKAGFRVGIASLAVLPPLVLFSVHFLLKSPGIRGSGG